jgi:hypothetical protein
MAEALDYVAMPATVIAAVKAMWARDIKDGEGKALFRPAH